MELPQISHQRFLFLSVLMDGGDRTSTEIRQAIGYAGSKPAFVMLVRSIHVDGLIDKFDVLRHSEDGSGKFYRQRVFRITDYGRQLWEEAADFYAWIINHLADESSENASDRIVHRQSVRPSYEAHEKNRMLSAACMKRYRQWAREEKAKRQNGDGGK